MYLYKLATSHGYSVSVHPALDSTTMSMRPDFLVSVGSVPVFYLEATTSADPLANEKEEKRRAIVLDAINTLPSANVWLAVAFESIGPDIPPLH